MGAPDVDVLAAPEAALETDARREPSAADAGPGARWRPSMVVALFVAALDIAIFAPLLRSGTLLLLDYSDYPVGPNAHLGSNAWGFAPGLTSRVPVNAVLLGLFRLLPWGPVTLLPLLLVPPLAAWGMYRLLGGRLLATIGATLLFVVNPFVYERMLAGQIYFVVGYALLPLFLSLVLSGEEGLRAPIAAGLLLALLVALSPHFVFLGGLVLAVAAAISPRRREERSRTLRRTGVTLLVAIGACLYWIIPIAMRASELGRVTGTDLQTFATRPDAAFGLGPNVAGLHGFWREAWPLPKDTLLAWPLLLATILVVAGIGLRAARSEGRRRLAGTLIVVGVSGFLLALGAQGPTAGAFRFLFDHLPGFRIMREPEKFEALLALAYAVLFGIGVRALASGSHTRKGRALVAIVILALPCAYTFRMFWGFGGYARPSTIPSSWSQASSMMGSGPRKVLALPGDQYLPFSWTQQRSVANPMASFLNRDVLIDGHLDLGGLEAQTTDARSRYLRFITDHGARTTRFGNLVAPLGVRYVLVSKTSDWLKYSWLQDQTDLRLVRSWPDLELFENLEPVSTAYAPGSTITVHDWGEVVGMADRVRLTDVAVTVKDAAPGPIREPDIARSPAPSHPLAVARSSPVGYDVASGGAHSIVLTEPFDPAWRLDGNAPNANLGVTDLFRTPAGEGVAEIRYSRWPLVRASYLFSAIAIVLALGALVLGTRRLRVRA